MAAWLLAALVGVSLAACRDTPAAPARASAATRAPFVDQPLRTTAPGIAMGNLNAQISALEQREARGLLTVAQRAALADLLAARGQFAGRIGDRERARAIGDELAGQAPDDPIALLARARGRAAFHQFDAALADLDRAAARGASRLSIDGARASIWQALGRYDEALALRQDAVGRHRSTETLGALASLLAERGEVDAASALYAEARAVYRDISPFPYAYLLFDEGLMWMRHGDPARARDLFAAAHRRLSDYAAVQCHFAEMEAELGNSARAIALLTPLAERSDDPDPAAQLARILAESGRAAESAHWRARAEARYAELLQRYPEAFADHGAEFWLGAGNDPARALAFARLNLSNRRTARAYELALAAADAVGDRDALCELRGPALLVAGRSSDLDDLLTASAATCTR